MGEVFERKIFWLTAGAAVSKNGGINNGFTLIEVMVVVIVIGILSTLAYSSLTELIFTNRAKETAQTMRTFAERALMEGKRLGEILTIEVKGNVMQYKTTAGSPVQEPLGNGFSGSTDVPNCEGAVDAYVSFNDGAKAQLKIGISSIVQVKDTTKSQGYFVACGAKGYCSAAVKIDNKNYFVACIKRGNNASWEAL